MQASKIEKVSGMEFRFSEKFVINSDVEPWCREGLRATMLGGPGSGKSWNNSLMAEQFLSQGGTVVIFQPRDEYYTLEVCHAFVCTRPKDSSFCLLALK